MDQLAGALLSFLSTNPIRELRKGLLGLLEANDDQVCVYYLVPLSNLVNIIVDGGIKCRSTVNSTIEDLSGYDVQAKRNKILKLARKTPSYSTIDKSIHECVNFFWNPINDTFRAFQRHSLLQEAEENDNTYGVVCILEMKLYDLLQSNKICWTTSQRNLAFTDFSTFSSRFYQDFDWQNIFSVENDKYSNQFRSAEFIVFIDNPELSVADLVPVQFTRRILVAAQHETKTAEMLPLFRDQIYSLQDVNVFYDKADLLNAEVNLINTIHDLESLVLSAEEFGELIDLYSNFGEQLGCKVTAEIFANDDIAYSVHGIGHVTRVIFWVNILCYLTGMNPHITRTALYAAFIHDSGRENNEDEQEHGSIAVKKFGSFLRQKQIPDYLMDRCMNAVIYHCQDDTQCANKDLVWKLLKDADSLDRGRFGHPQSIDSIRQPSDGCDVNYLRLDIFLNSQSLAEKLAWLGYWIALMTRYTKWSSDTFMDLKKVIVAGLKASLRQDILKQYQIGIAKRLLDGLL